MEEHKRRRDGELLPESEKEDQGPQRKRGRSDTPQETSAEEERVTRYISGARSGLPGFAWENGPGTDPVEIDDIARAIRADYADFVTAYSKRLAAKAARDRIRIEEEEEFFSERSIGTSSDEESEGDDSDYIPSDID